MLVNQKKYPKMLNYRILKKTVSTLPKKKKSLKL